MSKLRMVKMHVNLLCRFCCEDNVEFVETGMEWEAPHWICPSCDSTYCEWEYPLVGEEKMVTTELEQKLVIHGNDTKNIDKETAYINEEGINIIRHMKKTKDGVTILPGMRLYYNESIGSAGITSSIVNTVSQSAFFFYHSTPYYVTDGTVPVFSTQKDAMQHRAELLLKEAEKAQKEANKCE